jgi:hypothetical protein
VVLSTHSWRHGPHFGKGYVDEDEAHPTNEEGPDVACGTPIRERYICVSLVTVSGAVEALRAAVNSRELDLPRAHDNSAKAEDRHEAKASLQLLRLPHTIHVGAIGRIAMLSVASSIANLFCVHSVDLRVVRLGKHVDE